MLTGFLEHAGRTLSGFAPWAPFPSHPARVPPAVRVALLSCHRIPNLSGPRPHRTRPSETLPAGLHPPGRLGPRDVWRPCACVSVAGPGQGTRRCLSLPSPQHSAPCPALRKRLTCVSLTRPRELWRGGRWAECFPGVLPAIRGEVTAPPLTEHAGRLHVTSFKRTRQPSARAWPGTRVPLMTDPRDLLHRGCGRNICGR